MKSSVMMIGEFEFDSLFNDPNIKVPAVTWALFAVFVIIMTLLLMNLLVSTTNTGFSPSTYLYSVILLYLSLLTILLMNLLVSTTNTGFPPLSISTPLSHCCICHYYDSSSHELTGKYNELWFSSL